MGKRISFRSATIPCDRCGKNARQVHHVIVPFVTSKVRVDGTRRFASYSGILRLKNIWLCNPCIKNLKTWMKNWVGSSPKRNFIFRSKW